MPNHCSNSLTVTGEDADRFFAALERQTEDNFIAEFVPMPKELSGISTGSATIDGERVREWRDNADGTRSKITDIERQHAVDLHGTMDWYEWCRKHWGTKWGAYDVDYDGKATIRFDSAWSPPVPAIDTISRMFPRATFLLAYAEGGSCYFGTTTFENGAVIDSEESDQFWAETEESEDEEADYNPMDHLTPECRDHIETYGLHTGG